jgi:hypothetical protein
VTNCAVHRTHVPRPLRTVPHHIQPLAMGGADTPDNRVQVCDTGHYSIHRLLDDLLASDGHTMRRGGTALERSLARRGYAEWVAAGKPGRPVYEVEAP